MIFNSDSGYGGVAILLHWLSALVVGGMFGLGVWMMELDYYHGWYTKAPQLHKSVGVLFFLLLCLRFFWRLVNPVPRFEPGMKPWEALVARLVQYLFYLFMFLLPVTGYFISTADGQAVDVFGVFSIPAITQFDNSSDWVSNIHAWLAWMLVGLAGLHVAAALKHHFIDKDKTLIKMLRPTQGEKP